MPKFRRALGTLILVFLSAANARGRDLHLLGYDDETRDYSCIGNPVTPLCAVKTFFSCKYYREPFLCDRLPYSKGNGIADYAKQYERYVRFRYVVVSRKVIGAAELNELKHASYEDAHLVHKGDIRISVLWDACYPDKECMLRPMGDPAVPFGAGCGNYKNCETAFKPTYYILRRHHGRWDIVTTYY